MPEEDFLDKIEELKKIKDPFIGKKFLFIKKYSIHRKERRIVVSPNFFYYDGSKSGRFNLYKAIINYSVIKDRLLKITITILPNLYGFLFFGLILLIVCIGLYKGRPISGILYLGLLYGLMRMIAGSMGDDINVGLFKGKMNLYKNVSTKL